MPPVSKEDADLIAKGREAPSFFEKLKLWFAAPGYKPDWSETGLGETPVVSPLTHGEKGKYDADAPRGLRLYVWAQFLATIALTVILLFRGDDLTWPVQAGFALVIAWSAINVGALFDGRPWIVVSELTRLAVLWAGGLMFTADLGPAAIIASAAGGALLSGFFASWLLRYRSRLMTA